MVEDALIRRGDDINARIRRKRNKPKKTFLAVMQKGPL